MNTHPTIRILEDRVANQIAAGEVIERPAAVVKELVENALDAGASKITVEFAKGGRSMIRVDDDGWGMDRDSALLAFERHATSKISDTADLDKLSSFGFRGEALPSIASVSRCLLRTRTAEADAGTEVLIEAGRRIHVRDCGCPVGTSVEASRLFHSVPARRKFLKSDRTEGAHITSCVRLYALARPGTSFTLMEDGRRVFSSPACTDLSDRVGEIYGRRFAAELVSLDSKSESFRIHGLIGRPGLGGPTRQDTHVFVNGRPVDSRLVTYALAEGCGGTQPRLRFPAAVVFLECDPTEVDVNVHPAKREVRFKSEAAVRNFIVTSVARRFRELGGSSEPLAQDRSFRLEDASAPWHPSPGTTAPSLRSDLAGAGPGVDHAAERAGAGLKWRFLGSVHGDYALFEAPGGMVLLDHRAARERILFERLLNLSPSDSGMGQLLLIPAPLEMDPVSAAILLDKRTFLTLHGFGIAEFGRHFFRIESVPPWLEPGEAGRFVRDFIAEVREGRLSGSDPDLARDQLARFAASRPGGDPAPRTDLDAATLLGALFATRSPLTSPSGRPTFVELTHSELDRRFQKRLN